MSDWVDWDALEGDGAEVEEATAGLDLADPESEFSNLEPAPVRFSRKVGPGRYLMFEATPQEAAAMRGMGGTTTSTRTTTTTAPAWSTMDWGGLFSGLGSGIGDAAAGIGEAMARQTAAEAAAGAARDDASAMQQLLTSLVASQQSQAAPQPAGISGAVLVVGGLAVAGIVGLVVWAGSRKG